MRRYIRINYIHPHHPPPPNAISCVPFAAVDRHGDKATQKRLSATCWQEAVQGAPTKGRQSHQAAVEAAVMENKALGVDAQLSSIRIRNIAENCLNLKSIVETVILCGRQGIPLRGHRDENPHVQQDPLANDGNFLALLHFRAQAGDDALKEHLQNLKGNARYTSHVIQITWLVCLCNSR